MSTHFIHQANDKLFKLSLEQPAVAREFFLRHLPQKILSRVDLSTLVLGKETFIDESFKGTEADVIYRVTLDSEKIAYFFLLCEQQSSIDDHMAFRLQKYMLRVIENHHRQHPRDPLPLVFPLVLYTGETEWTAPRDIFPLFGQHSELARELWTAPYQLVDVCRISDDDLLQDKLSGLVQFVFKYRKNQRDFKRFIDIVITRAEVIEKEYPEAAYLIKPLVRYIMDAMQEPGGDVNRDLLIERAQTSSSTLLRGNVMTFAQQFEQIGLEKGIQQGMQQGIQQGIQQGMQQGMHEGEAAVLKRLLTRRFGPLDFLYIKKLEAATESQLLLWSERILDAKSLSEVFGE